MAIKTIFLDRDGVINKEINYLHKINDFEFIDGIFSACHYFETLGYKIIIITNQSGISRGYYNELDYELLTKWMLSEFKDNGVKILDVFHCPHDPNDRCNCRKPKPGMFLNAQNKYNIDMKNSWMIGDKEVDISAANKAGILNTILVRSGHMINENQSDSMHIIDSIKKSNSIISD
jgi:D-glycero-D-manno-heptose 1,7-bisphosphate phosphatase